MRKISSATVQRILEATDIVEVVSDFVSLKRRGANWVGLCPFHNDRSPSFYVSKAKGVCKCFSCGEGGSAVNFIMKLEQLTYYEALRYLAKKYNIEVEERELTDDERRAETARENMLAINDFAMRFFEKYMKDSEEGRNIGLSYFRYRGISDNMIEKFHLGFAPEQRDALYKKAVERGYSEEYLITTGLCTRTEDGKIFDRFRGRVIYPIFTLSGKVVAFGGRTLRKEKTIAKYVNSPESDIYSKRRELYGLFQAKQAIAKTGKCIIVEGYMDVISMHQAGICNVVASSGTALTVEQVKLIKRFTSNVTLIYDADAAGIKASLRGIELLLEEGMDIKVLLLPEGEDPDSFAQSHSSTEVEQFIAENETDFVTFMAGILMKTAADDPAQRARVITRIVKTIALIPNEITRSVYIQECSRILFISEDVLQREVGKSVNELALKSREDKMRAESLTTVPERISSDEVHGADERYESPAQAPTADPVAATLRPYEMALMKLIARYGNYRFAELLDEDGQVEGHISVLEYICDEFERENISITNPDLAHFFREAVNISNRSFGEDLQHEEERLKAVRAANLAKGIEEIRGKATDVGSISAMEKSLVERLDNEYAQGLEDFTVLYISKLLGSSPDDLIRTLTTELVTEKHILSKMHTKYAHIDTEQDLLPELVPRTIYELQDAMINIKKRELHDRLKAIAQDDMPEIMKILEELKNLDKTRSEIAKYIGDRVIAPRKQ